MRYPVDLHAAHLPKLLNTFLAVIGTDVWEKRARDIVTHLDQVPILRDLVFARHRIEIELARFVSRVGDARGAPVLVDNESEFELVAFMSAVVSVFERLSEKGKNRMRGMLRDGLQTDMGLLPLQHELTVATHLRSRGFNVVFQDMDGEGGADYIARRGVTEIEIECKMISGDIGRMIHRRKAVNLLWALLQSANHMPETNSKGIFVRVTVPGRLHGSDNERDAVINAVRTSVATPNQSAENEFCSISIEAIDLATAVFTAGTVETLTGDVLRDYVQERFGVGNVNVLSSVVLGRSILVACVESRQKDRVLESMLQTLKKSAKAQFGKTRARSRMVA